MRAPKGAACRFTSATATSSFKFPTASETPNGSESQSDWYSSRHHPRLVVEVVCAFEELRLEYPHRLPGAQVSEQEAGRCLGEQHSYRAGGPPRQHHHSHGPAGNRDRQEGRGHRETPHRGG